MEEVIPYRVEKAHNYAISAHEGQKRKYTGQDYIIHPVRVSQILFNHGYVCESMHCAALLHDVVEDCDVTFKEIYDEFGEETGDLVFWLTNVSRPEDGNRRVRKRLDRLHTSGAPFKAQIIKCADITDNSYSILEYDPDFAVVFRPECMKTLELMSDKVKSTEIYKDAVECLT